MNTTSWSHLWNGVLSRSRLSVRFFLPIHRRPFALDAWRFRAKRPQGHLAEVFVKKVFCVHQKDHVANNTQKKPQPSEFSQGTVRENSEAGAEENPWQNQDPPE